MPAPAAHEWNPVSMATKKREFCLHSSHITSSSNIANVPTSLSAPIGKEKRCESTFWMVFPSQICVYRYRIYYSTSTWDLNWWLKANANDLRTFIDA